MSGGETLGLMNAIAFYTHKMLASRNPMGYLYSTVPERLIGAVMQNYLTIKDQIEHPQQKVG